MNQIYMQPGFKDFHRYTEMGFQVVQMLCTFYHVKVLLTMEQKLTSVSHLLCRLEDCFHRLMPIIRVRFALTLIGLE